MPYSIGRLYVVDGTVFTDSYYVEDHFVENIKDSFVKFQELASSSTGAMGSNLTGYSTSGSFVAQEKEADYVGSSSNSLFSRVIEQKIFSRNLVSAVAEFFASESSASAGSSTGAVGVFVGSMYTLGTSAIGHIVNASLEMIDISANEKDFQALRANASPMEFATEGAKSQESYKDSAIYEVPTTSNASSKSSSVASELLQTFATTVDKSYLTLKDSSFVELLSISTSVKTLVAVGTVGNVGVSAIVQNLLSSGVSFRSMARNSQTYEVEETVASNSSGRNKSNATSELEESTSAKVSGFTKYGNASEKELSTSSKIASYFGNAVISLLDYMSDGNATARVKDSAIALVEKNASTQSTQRNKIASDYILERASDSRSAEKDRTGSATETGKSTSSKVYSFTKATQVAERLIPAVGSFRTIARSNATSEKPKSANTKTTVLQRASSVEENLKTTSVRSSSYVASSASVITSASEVIKSALFFGLGDGILTEVASEVYYLLSIKNTFIGTYQDPINLAPFQDPADSLPFTDPADSRYARDRNTFGNFTEDGVSSYEE